jgi:hypothetical protein
MARDLRIGVATALSPLVTFSVAAALVGVRGEIRPEIVAVTLAAAVALCGRFGGRAGGVAAALMAAASFDFLHTKPYLSLKMNSGNDILLTFLLLGVGLIVGGLAGQAADARRQAGDTSDRDRLRRALAIARDSELEDVEAAVRAELLGLLGLRACWFDPDTGRRPVLGPWGELEMKKLRFSRGGGHAGFELPEEGVAVKVSGGGRTFGYLICIPTSGFGVSIEDRQAAAGLGEVLGLAMNARSTAA